jgi:hypothetical protein
MSQIGFGYGSEWHLLRFLGRHRNELNRRTIEQTGGEAIDWLDFHFDRKERYKDSEWKGLDFVDGAAVSSEWATFWPQGRQVQNWDAIGRLRKNGAMEWLLVEAKAHVKETLSRSKAEEAGGLPKIRIALQQTMAALGIQDTKGFLPTWLEQHYQYANRLAVLHFLSQQKIPAHLLLVYFCGDEFKNMCCPKTPDEWKQHIDLLHRTMGIDGSCEFMKRVHHLFLPVCQ